MGRWPHFAPMPRYGFLPCFVMILLGAVPAAAGSLSGTVYVDENMNGLWDRETEWVLPNIEMHLVNAHDPIHTLATWTDENGYYAFDGLLPGSYTISQVGLLQEYINVNVGVGELLEWPSGDPWPDARGTVVNYDPANDILPQVTRIQCSGEDVRGIQYDFGQIWLGKFLYLSRGLPPGDPPHANPPPPHLVPEPGTLFLLGIAALAVGGLRLFRRRKPGRTSPSRPCTNRGNCRLSIAN